MATYARSIRRGLPRRHGGDPWPPAGVPPVAESPKQPAEPPAATLVAEHTAPVAVASTSSPIAAASTPQPDTRMLRRGLPRVPGGEPWPAPTHGTLRVDAAIGIDTSSGHDHVATPGHGHVATESPAVHPADTVTTASAPVKTAEVTASGRPLRRGLPRATGGEPWPLAGFAPEQLNEPVVAPDSGSRDISQTESGSTADPIGPEAPPPPASSQIPAPAGTPSLTKARQAQRYGPLTRLQWAGAGFGSLLAATILVLAVRWLTGAEFMQDFLTTYPGEYQLPDGAPVGIPSWIGWQHFFNVFLMVLIIRSGLQVRTEKRPRVFWTPRWPKNGQTKISLTLWFHLSLDILWLVNGLLFIVLLFATGQWMRIVPTSLDVFPNAVSAALQYMSLDWPTENGWVHYNSLQQLAYFMTVFLAAPIAAITGVRMSGIWPKDAKALNKAYPVELARALHFPVMLYFVLFIIAHVTLVLATGALRNLNHMYASQDEVNWVGFWIFVASLFVVAAGWLLARPLVLAPIARAFGKVGR